MKRFTLITLFIFLIIRFDNWECKFGLPMDFQLRGIPESHPHRQAVITLHGELSTMKKKIPNINFGGCGVFAFEMKKALDSVGISTSIWIIDDEQEYLNKKQYMNEVLNYGMSLPYESMSVNHVILIFDELRLGLDAAGVHNITYHPKIEDRPYMWHGMYIMGQYTMKELEYAAYKSCWNHRFNRRRIPEMKYYISLIKDSIEGKIRTHNDKTLKRLKAYRRLLSVIDIPKRIGRSFI